MPVVKGGVWTNIEDEILKASVSKYGLNQWARVSSLLARKTPKQCKARWNEWLDPSIKKIEWSRDEDEKLLHVAKLMPTQWMTIAQQVGRTAKQCLDRYQKLLDEAEARDGLELTGQDGSEALPPSADDTRRLRPGEVDPDPETKPARPDTIDLDEDEKEMLSEARARLANTQGKKAKRKARERAQEESRRLAALQKRRELKAAGINIKVTTHKKGQMDFNADIPFEKKPTPGFYDTMDEKSRNEYQLANFDPKKFQLSQKRKGDEEDGTDRKRRKDDKEGGPSASQAAMKAAQMQRIREAEQSSKRRALVLPEPQVDDGELEEIVKMGMMGERANNLARASENDATRGLVSDYLNLTSSNPIRTPMAPPSQDHIANELRNIRALTQTQSSLLGGENTPLHEGSASTGFDGIAPRKQVTATPNPLATPLRAPNGVGATPRHPGQTPLRTPRDSFALNTSDGFSAPSATPRDVKLHNLAMRQQLRQGLASLPKPKDDTLTLEEPEDMPDPTGTGDEVEEDAAEIDRRHREAVAARDALEFSRRTRVMQRTLPRPAVVDLKQLAPPPASSSSSSSEDGGVLPPRLLIAREAASLMAHDAAKYPVPGARLVGFAPDLDGVVDDEARAAAKRMVLAETRPVPSLGEIQEAFDGRSENPIRRALACYDSDEEVQEAAMRAAFESEQDAIMASAERGAKLEKKLALHLGGYQKRDKMLRDKIVQAHGELEKANNALSAFKMLAVWEEVTIERRMGALKDEVAFISRREREAQEEYRKLKEELSHLR